MNEFIELKRNKNEKKIFQILKIPFFILFFGQWYFFCCGKWGKDKKKGSNFFIPKSQPAGKSLMILTKAKKQILTDW